MTMDQRSYEEIGRDLQELGIGGITEEMTQTLEESYAKLPAGVAFSKVLTLLSAAGQGTFVFSPAVAWTPAHSGVYSFDVECFDERAMYTHFLEGVADLSGGELAFANISEDLSRMNADVGTGSRSVSFDWNGTRYTMEMTAQQEWFDMKAARQLSRIIREAGGEKQLYFVGDGYQDCIVFYRDAQWAEKFRQKTGLPLATL